MPVDVRATVTCSLGTLISGNLSDSYIQGNGLVQTQGAVEIAGTITPAVGTAVTFAYKYNGGTRNLPRKLRVLSSFADPLRRTTRVQLGCKLTYLSDLRQRLKWSALDDPANAGLNAADAEIITIPIHASSVFTKCLTELGLTASSNPLTNRFSVAEYDYSAGYVAVMAELLTSENYFGYLDFNEVLQVVNLNQNGGTAVVVGTGQIIDLSDINAGALPGEAVTVNYSSLQLKAAPAVDDWSTSRSSNRSSVTISYSDPLDGSRQGIVFSVLETEEETSEFQPLTKASTQERINVLSYRKVVRKESSPKVLGSVMVQFLEAGISPPVAQLVTTTEEWFYYDAEGNEIRTVKETYADRAYGFGQVSLPMVFDVTSGGVTTKQAVSLPIGQTYLQDATETDTTVQGTLRKVVTRRYGNWLATIAGQQSVAESRNSFTTKAEVEDYLDTALSGRWFLGADIRTEDNTSSSQRVPFKPEIINQQYSTNGNPANGYRTESSSQVVLALGSATAQRRTEFSLPKAPDDYFYKSGGGYGSIRSDAKAKAKAYGSVQNRLLLGNRSGMNLRLAAWQMPEAPFAPLVVQANGLSALYRTNANSYTISAEGIVAATDALFWGAVGGTGSFWFPVAPGVTTLPSTPATSTLAITGTNDASQTVTIATLTTMAVSSLVLPYNETAVLAPTTRTTLVATSLPYALTASTAQAITTKTKMTGRRVRLIDVPATAVTVASATPQVSISALVSAPLVAVTVAAAAPAVASGASVAVPVVDVTIAGVVPDLVGRLKTQVIIPAAEVAVIVGLPAVSTGSLIAVPSAAISVAAQAPVIYDSDALKYIAAVEAADGQALEVAIYEAIDNFVRGCKSDGIWSAIKSCCILAGARTLNGALTPLKGTAPTNTGFVSGDYNRETGLIGNGSSKYLDANRADNAETQNNQHLAAYMSSGQSSGLGGIIGNGKTNGSYIYDEISTWFKSRGGSEFFSAGSDTSFVGLSRAVSGSFVTRKAGTSTTRTQTSSSPDAGNIYVFALNGNSGAYMFSSSRLAFYSIGEALTLSTLNSRVATLITAIGNAI